MAPFQNVLVGIDLSRCRRFSIESLPDRAHDVFERLPRITCPTLVAAGRYDGIAPPRNAEAIAAQVTNAELRIYDGGHAFFAQDRRALPEVMDFLEGS